MKIVDLIQGTHEWHAHRATHFNASDAPAMMGYSPYKTRSQLVRELATGIVAEVDEHAQRRFDEGHQFEELARPLAEAIIGDDLYPVVGVAGKYSASFDGLTLCEKVSMEHKRLNQVLRDALPEDGFGDARALPLHYRVQMEHQLMVSNSQATLFLATNWDDGQLTECRKCWYESDPALRAQIFAGWAQLEADVAAYDASKSEASAAIGMAPQMLPALHIQVQGAVTASNIDAFRAVALSAISTIKTDLHTDQDFADAEKTVKWCGDVESRIEAAKQHALSQTASIESLFRAMDEISAEARAVRLRLEKLVKSEKEARKEALIIAAASRVNAYIAKMNTQELLEEWISYHGTHEFAAATKGKRSLDAMRDALAGVIARLIAEADSKAALYQANRASLVRGDMDWIILFPDFAAVGCKPVEEFKALSCLRISQHQQDTLKAQIEAQRQSEAAQQQVAAVIAEATAASAEAAPREIMLIPPSVDQTLTIGQINLALDHIRVDAAGLSALGFRPIETKGRAMLYRADDLPKICAAIAAHATKLAQAYA